MWMSHGDHVDGAAAGLRAHRRVATTARCRGFANAARKIYGVQFHPEVVHTPRGAELLGNFLFDVCGAAGDWTMASFVDEAIAQIRAQVGADGRVICGLSGGVDSSVAAALIHRAIGDRLTCIFVDNGLLRHGEREQVATIFRDHFHVDLRVIDAEERFLDALAGRHRPREEAQDHRPRVHRGLRGGGEEDRERAVPRAGHALPRRDRERVVQGPERA